MSIVYILNICDQIAPQQYQDLVAELPPNRREAAYRFRFRRDRLRCVYGGAMIRYAARRHLPGASLPPALHPNEYGKPYLTGYPGHFFNLSHSGEWVVCAWDEAEIGVDVEEVGEADAGVAARVFTQEERGKIFRQRTVLQQKSHFYKCWTLKESYIKYLGVGMSLSLQSFSVDPDRDPPLLHAPGGPQPFLTLIPLDSSHKLGLCAETPLTRVERLSPQMLWSVDRSE